MTSESLRRANEIQSQINKLEDFMFWCSGSRDGCRTYPMSVFGVRRKWYGPIEEQEYKFTSEMTELKGEIMDAFEREIARLREELDSL